MRLEGIHPVPKCWWLLVNVFHLVWNFLGSWYVRGFFFLKSPNWNFLCIMSWDSTSYLNLLLPLTSSNTASLPHLHGGENPGSLLTFLLTPYVWRFSLILGRARIPRGWGFDKDPVAGWGKYLGVTYSLPWHCGGCLLPPRRQEGLPALSSVRLWWKHQDPFWRLMRVKVSFLHLAFAGRYDHSFLCGAWPEQNRCGLNSSVFSGCLFSIWWLERGAFVWGSFGRCPLVFLFSFLFFFYSYKSERCGKKIEPMGPYIMLFIGLLESEILGGLLSLYFMVICFHKSVACRAVAVSQAVLNKRNRSKNIFLEVAVLAVWFLLFVVPFPRYVY